MGDDWRGAGVSWEVGGSPQILALHVFAEPHFLLLYELKHYNG